VLSFADDARHFGAANVDLRQDWFLDDLALKPLIEVNGSPA
jgi:hypothetical protein